MAMSCASFTFFKPTAYGFEIKGLASMTHMLKSNKPFIKMLADKKFIAEKCAF